MARFGEGMGQARDVAGAVEAVDGRVQQRQSPFEVSVDGFEPSGVPGEERLQDRDLEWRRIRRPHEILTDGSAWLGWCDGPSPLRRPALRRRGAMAILSERCQTIATKRCQSIAR